MAKKLVIVESPTKTKTIQKFLGPDFEVLATYGHVRDLLPKEGAVVPEENFLMKYILIDQNRKHVDRICQAAKEAEEIYLATDPDREGEAIAWHVVEILKERNVLKGQKVYRIVFHEITKRAIEEALRNPRAISRELVEAQKARRALDYLVGFNLSPLLWRKIKPGLSAGRVQSPALRLIVEREEEIARFKPQEYWTLEANLRTKGGQEFSAKLIRFRGEKVKTFTLTSEKEAKEARETLLQEAGGFLTVVRVEKKERRRSPQAPFITSTLQQEANRKLGFSAKKTMMLAQQLYEGVPIDGENTGLITYMRTDSTHLAEEAVEAIRRLIAERFGQAFLPSKPRQFKVQSKNAQEAHEAIRPTDITRTPDALKPYLTEDQLKLYELIWRRTVACQMREARYEVHVVDLACGGEAHVWRATGSQLIFPGFLAVEREGEEERHDRLLPPLEEGELLELLDILARQHFTEPPPRYTEASLVKTLEEYGIGRPSTYATIISTLLQRGYVVLENKRFKPTDLGRIVHRFLTGHFTRYVDYDFTAQMEDQLDAIARGEKPWTGVLREFWEPFRKQVEEKARTVSRKEVTSEELDERCPECGGKLLLRLGRSGRFIGCSNFPRCRYTRPFEEEPPEPIDRNCPECGAALQIRQGRYGRFIGCSGYPECRYIEPLEKPEDTGVLCPQCKKGTLVRRRSRKGKVFYACSGYPECDYALWHPPLGVPCPKCGWPILMVKTTKRRGSEKVCPQKGCDYAEAILEEAISE